MKVHQVVRAVLASSVISLGACAGTDTTVPVIHAAVIAIVRGNAQTANVNDTLAARLLVRVSNSDGTPAVNEPVEWLVTTGGGKLTEVSDHTDTDGYSSAKWNLGTWGKQSATASLTETAIHAVQFTATAAAPVILRYDGNTWASHLEDSSGAGLHFLAVSGLSSSALYAVGFCSWDWIRLFNDGAAWTVAPGTCTMPLIIGAPQLYTSVAANAAGDVYTVARADYFGEIWIERRTGQTWSQIYYGGARLNTVWSQSTNDVIAIGDAGVVMRYDGTGWGLEASGTRADLHAIWGDAASAVTIAVGQGGTIIRYDGTSWHPQESGTAQALYGVWGTSPTDVFAVGAAGTIVHYDGISWTPQNSGTTQSLRGVWGNAANSVFAVGDSSTILRYGGSSWTHQQANASIQLEGVWGSSPTNVFAVGHVK